VKDADPATAWNPEFVTTEIDKDGMFRFPAAFANGRPAGRGPADPHVTIA
jgi:hypothetical protein